MITCIFTLDYEIYGNGEGSLKYHILEPARKLKNVFDKVGGKLVVFVEAAELEIIERNQADSEISEIKQQVQALYQQGHEIALHLHPQWYKGHYRNNRWALDYTEYNLCTLPKDRICKIVDGAINYLKTILKDPDFIPFSFRAGNWLFQPTETAAEILKKCGIRVDSSVFKGGRQHHNMLDYRPALKNGYYWTFSNDVNTPDPNGGLLELPIYGQMVPIWKMATCKRIGIQKKTSNTSVGPAQKLNRIRDFLRPRHPLKLDFCRMTAKELTRVIDTEIRKDREDPSTLKPLVAIGHTKDLIDLDTISFFLDYLTRKNIPISTLKETYYGCIHSNNGY